MKSRSKYHHGGLRNALVSLAVTEIARAGVEKLSLRSLARQAGVSPTAPFRHFPDKQSLLASIAIEGFGELFRYLSFKKIGTSTIQSRAVAGTKRGKYIFCLPGSPSACKDAWDKILKFQLDIRHKPCNFIEILPRLNES